MMILSRKYQIELDWRSVICNFNDFYLKPKQIYCYNETVRAVSSNFKFAKCIKQQEWSVNGRQPQIIFVNGRGTQFFQWKTS